MIRTRESALCKLRKKYRAKKLKEVCQLDSNRLIQSLSSSLNEDTSTFLASIVRNSKHDPKGKRWSYKEKVLAVSILKRSPRSYTFLRSLFPLPSRRSLQSLLNTVQFGTGINAHVFSVLKVNVQTMSDKDRMCCLMFDEMSIRGHLHFNQKIDCIEGFEEIGRHGRTSNIANHALVFMLRGLRKRWKQPVAYYLTRRSTKGDMLVDFLMEVLDACHNAGLVVVATVFDMGANNVKAFKQLGVSVKISEVPSPLDVYTGFKEHSSTVQSLTYLTEKLVETVGTAVTVLENVMSMVAHLDSVELYVTDAIMKLVGFDWIRSAGCSLHYQGLEDGIVTGATRI